jgi:hypothetical protein
VKLLHYLLAAAGAVSICACTVAPSITAPSVLATADALAVRSGFEPDFYRSFLQNAFEAPARLEPIRVLPGPFRIYLRVQDDTGRDIDPAALDATERTLIDTVWIWSGETYTLTEVLRGTGTREKVPGWITVKWSSSSVGDRCGRSTVGVDGGFIEFNDAAACRCGLPSGVYPRLIRHELGHAMGYYHTDSPEDVMYGRAIPPDSCDVQPSERERRHARFAHAGLR